MVPDSGSQGFVLFERGGRMPLRVDESGQHWDVSDVAGARRVGRGVVLRELAVGSVTLRDQPAVVVAREDPAGVAADGLLPLHAFSSVAFHNGEAYLVVRR